MKCKGVLGALFGHKWFYRMWAAGLTQPTDYCVRCGYVPRGGA